MIDVRERFRPQDHPNEHFILTTVVGSYPKPTWLQQARVQQDNGELPADSWEEALDDAVRVITAEHEAVGLDVVADGEMGRTEMVEYFAHRIGGFTFNGPVKVWGHNYFDKPSVVDAVEYENPWLLDEFSRVDSVASRPVKVPITGPYTLAQWSFNEHYADTKALAHALAGLVRREIETLVEAGATYIQIDEPALATTPDDYDLVGTCLERVTEGIPPEIRIGLHVCYGDYARIYPEVLSYPVHEIDLELANTDFSQAAIFTEVPFTKELGFGVVDVHDTSIESVEEIKANVRRGLDIVPPERLTVSPDCGLKLLPRPIAKEKLRNMVTAVRAVEAELDAET